MKTWKWNEAWLSNYLAFRPYPNKLQNSNDKDFYLDEIFWLAVLSRGVNKFIDREQIKGNTSAVRLCLFVLAKIRCVADFTQLILAPEENGYIAQIRNAQKRLEGILENKKSY